MNISVVEDLAHDHPEIVREGQRQMSQLLEKSATDLDFRQRLINDPRQTLFEETGEVIPETMDIVFVENQADATFVLPPYRDADGELEGELLAEELEAVAGGEAVVASTLGIIAGVLTIAASIGYIVND